MNKKLSKLKLRLKGSIQKGLEDEKKGQMYSLEEVGKEFLEKKPARIKIK